MSIQNFIDELTANLKEVANNENRISMEVYMKNHFEFFGIRSPLRKADLQKLETLHQKLFA